jgi:RNA polymerase sigma factor (sigma-70 family)
MCVVNGCRDRLRRQSRWRARIPLLARSEHAPSDEGPGHRADVEHELLDRLHALPARQRAALVLRFYDDCTTEEIAVALGVSTSSAKSLPHRGMQTLRTEVSHG